MQMKILEPKKKNKDTKMLSVWGQHQNGGKEERIE